MQLISNSMIGGSTYHNELSGGEWLIDLPHTLDLWLSVQTSDIQSFRSIFVHQIVAAIDPSSHNWIRCFHGVISLST